MENISLEEFEANLLVQPEDARLTPAEINLRDKVNAAIKELGLNEDEDGEAISALFKKFSKEL